MEIWSIINVTPDSFWSGSRARSEREVAHAAIRAIDQGANVLDIGAFSTRPGYSDVDENEEFARLDIALETIAREIPSASISIDTFRSSIVAKVYDKYGQFIVNDIQGGTLDKHMYATVAHLGLDYVMMSMDPTMELVETFFARQITAAREAGITGRIILDPGFGFGKSKEQNFNILLNMKSLKHFGLDILAGISRKSMIWRTLDSTPDEALAGTCALHWQALLSGAHILRVHDTRAASDVVRLFSAAYPSQK